MRVRACVCGGGGVETDFLSVLQLDKAAYLSSTLHTSQQPLCAFVRRIRARPSSRTEETRIRAQVNATRRKQGGVRPCASINGRTGGGSGSPAPPTAVRPRRRRNSPNKREDKYEARVTPDHRYVRGDPLEEMKERARPTAATDGLGRSSHLGLLS